MIGQQATALFVWLISRTFSANEHYFCLTTNQPTVFSAMTYQPNEHGILGCGKCQDDSFIGTEGLVAKVMDDMEYQTRLPNQMVITFYHRHALNNCMPLCNY